MDLFAVQTDWLVAMETIGKGTFLITHLGRQPDRLDCFFRFSISHEQSYLTLSRGHELFSPDVQQLLVGQVAREERHAGRGHVALLSTFGTNDRVVACAQLVQALGAVRMSTWNQT